MAVVVGKVNTNTVPFHAGDRLFVTIDIKCDSAYPTNGSALTAAKFGLSELDFVLATATTVGTTFAYDYVNSKLKAFTAGVEVANATDLSAETTRVLAIGKGFPLTGVYG